jgi:hypothetical protein
MHYENDRQFSDSLAAAERQRLTEPAPDADRDRLLAERERCLARIAEIEDTLWEEYGFVPTD